MNDLNLIAKENFKFQCLKCESYNIQLSIEHSGYMGSSITGWCDEPSDITVSCKDCDNYIDFMIDDD